MSTSYVADESENRFKRKLMELGLLKSIATPSNKPEGERTLIKVKGKPISQTIIENRR